jgi:S-adenosylmethionine:tRNA ribosyltransferase-isomerase
VRVDLLDYQLPEGAIAQRPAERRDAARLLVLGSGADGLADRRMAEWPSLVPRGSLVVLNDTKVVRARLIGKKAKTGGKAELLLVERLERSDRPPMPREPPAHGEPQSSREGETEVWRALGKGLRELVGQELVFSDGAIVAVVLGPSRIEGLYEVRVSARLGSVTEALASHGHVPIPPYIRRADDAADDERYQTVYGCVPGAIAAPTAGLHLTRAMLDELARRDVDVGYLTLHVGLGTFQPVASADLDDHPMHAEWMCVPDALVRAVARARERRASVVAVGTTVVRALETAADPGRRGLILPLEGETRILIQPGHDFHVVDALLTNFHLPKSTLLALVSAFAGRERTLGAYREAVGRGYRFYSYGDAMWIPERAS